MTERAYDAADRLTATIQALPPERRKAFALLLDMMGGMLTEFAQDIRSIDAEPPTGATHGIPAPDETPSATERRLVNTTLVRPQAAMPQAAAIPTTRGGHLLDEAQRLGAVPLPPHADATPHSRLKLIGGVAYTERQHDTWGTVYVSVEPCPVHGKPFATRYNENGQLLEPAHNNADGSKCWRSRVVQ